MSKCIAHQTSHALVGSGAKLIVFEDLKILNMVRKPKAKKDESGRFLPNGASAKAGLNRAILSSAWGRIADFTQYKAARRNVVVAFVQPHYSSQECSLCRHTEPDNRQASLFVCKRCRHAQHADLNAAANIAKRGILLLRSGELEKPPKAPTVRRKQRSRKPLP